MLYILLKGKVGVFCFILAIRSIWMDCSFMDLLLGGKEWIQSTFPVAKMGNWNSALLGIMGPELTKAIQDSNSVNNEKNWKTGSEKSGWIQPRLFSVYILTENM